LMFCQRIPCLYLLRMFTLNGWGNWVSVELVSTEYAH
jgi:hypothetical protein